MSNKKPSPRPADPVILKGPNAIEPMPNDEPQQLKLQAFPDGSVFKYAVHPKEAGTFVMFDSNNKPVAFFENPAICRLCCDAVRMLFAAVEQHKRDAALPPTTCAEVLAARESVELTGHNPPVMES